MLMESLREKKGHTEVRNHLEKDSTLFLVPLKGGGRDP